MSKNLRHNNIYAMIALILCVAQLCLILVSWLLAAALPTSGIQSLLSEEGIRWFFSNFTDNLAAPYLIWFVLCCIAYGALRGSGLWRAMRSWRRLDYPKRTALRFVAVEFIVFFIVMLLLTAVPHAILLNLTGHLFPGSFSLSIIPYVCFSVCVFAVSFGLISGSLQSLQSVYHCLSVGITYTVPLWIIYILGVEFCYSILFVFVR